MKTTIASIVFVVTATVSAVPTTNTYVAVTNDWYNGNWSNVYELALRLSRHVEFNYKAYEYFSQCFAAGIYKYVPKITARLGVLP